MTRRQWRKLSEAERVELAGGPQDPYMRPTLAEELERLGEALRELGRTIVRAVRS